MSNASVAAYTVPKTSGPTYWTKLSLPDIPSMSPKIPDQPTTVRKKATPDRSKRMVAAEACERAENSRSGTDVGAFFIFSWATGWDTSVASPKKTGDHILNDHRGGDDVPTPVCFSELLHQ